MMNATSCSITYSAFYLKMYIMQPTMQMKYIFHMTYMWRSNKDYKLNANGLMTTNINKSKPSSRV